MDFPALPRNPRPGDILTVRVEELVDGGLGRARFEALVGPGKQHSKLDVQVRGGLPGELVQVRVEGRHRRKLAAQAIGLIERSADRITPRCRHHGRPDEAFRGCGGCSLQSLSYQRQLALKHDHVATLLRRARLDPSVLGPVVPCEPPWMHRNKMEFSFADDREGGVGPGMHPPGYRHEVIALRECFLQSEATSGLAVAVGRFAREHGVPAHEERRDQGWLRTLTVREGKRTGEWLVELATSGHARVGTARGELPAEALAAEIAALARAFAEGIGRPLTGMYWTRRQAQRGEKTSLDSQLLFGLPVLRERLDVPGGRSLHFEIHPHAFFQPNTRGAERLYAEVLRAAADPQQRAAHVLDLYCGTGTIGIALADRADRVTGIELQPDAVDNARRNAALNGVDNATFHCGDVAEVLAREGLAGTAGVDVVVVDPPRSGLTARALAQVASIGAPRIIYVSCNPSSLARDAALLAREGYRLQAATPVDQFPHTWHIETVARLVRG